MNEHRRETINRGGADVCLLTSVGARAVEWGRVGLYGRPRGVSWPFIDEPASPGEPRRVTIKPHPASTRPPSPLQNPGLKSQHESPLSRAYESNFPFRPTMGGPRAPAPHPQHSRPYAKLGHYGVPSLALLILFILALFLFPLS